MGSVEIWRTFLYHSMLIVLGIYIGLSGECGLRFRDVRIPIVTVVCLDFLTFYLNSMMSTPYYQGDVLMGVGNAVNYFSSYNNPLGIAMSTKGAWLVYLLIRYALGAALIILLQLWMLKKRKKGR